LVFHTAFSYNLINIFFYYSVLHLFFSHFYFYQFVWILFWFLSPQKLFSRICFVTLICMQLILEIYMNIFCF